MARNPMPTPSADSSYNFNSDKNKKKKQTAGGVKTVTPPPQPAHEVNRTSNTTHSTNSSVPAPKQTQIYEQPVSKTETSVQTNGYLSAASSYNPLTVKQNNHNTQNNGMDSIYNKTVTYDAVPTPKTQHGSYKPPAQKTYTYTEPTQRTNQYVNNAVNTYTAPKQQMYTSPKTYPSTLPKTNIGEYKTLGGYTNANPYVTKDRVADYGQNNYFAQPKSQEKNSYTGVKNQNAVDELWKRYYAEIAGKNETVQPKKPIKTSDSQKQKTQTVKAGKSTINIRDDGSTIHYDSDTAIDLFDFLDFLSGNYGPNNEMAESVNRKKGDLSIPDLISKAQPKNNIENSVLEYEDMIRKPDAVYGVNADEWIANAPENWENTYKDKWFYKIFGDWIYNNIIVPNIDGLKTSEKEILLDNLEDSVYLYSKKESFERI